MLLALHQNLNLGPIPGGAVVGGAVRKRIRIDDKEYWADPIEEMLLVQMHLQSLNDMAKEVRTEIRQESKKAKKPLRPPEMASKDASSTEPPKAQKRLQSLTASLKTIDASRRAYARKLKKIRQRVQDDEALSFILMYI